MMQRPAEPAGLVRPSGDDLLDGLEHDVGRVPTFEQGWQRLCETAWRLGLANVRLIPDPAQEARVPRLHETAPGAAPVRGNWAFDVRVGPVRMAVVTFGRGTAEVGFDPIRLVAAVQVLVERFVEPDAV